MGKRIAVLGAGGIGGSVGFYLSQAGHDVTLIDQWAEHVQTMQRQGLTLTDVNREATVPVKALHLSDVSNVFEPFDIVFLSVKSYDTPWMAQLVAPHLGPGSFVLPTQNALNDEAVAQVVGYGRTVGCVTTISAGVYEPGHVVRTDPITTHAFDVGELHGRITPRVREVVAMLQVIGPADGTTNIWGSRWAKLIWNSMGNALAGLMGADTRGITPAQSDKAAMIRAVTGVEAAHVAAAMGVAIEPIRGIPGERFATASTQAEIVALKDALEHAAGERTLTPEQLQRLGVPGRPSLLQDVIKGRRTEVDFLNGEIVRQGAAAGIATPMNAAIVELMHRVERGEVRPGLDNLARLAPYIG